METKVCNRCGKEKSIDEFHYRNKSKNTRDAQCKECKSIKSENRIRRSSEDMNKVCTNCGTLFKCSSHQIKRSKSGNVFCCKKCALDFNRPKQIGENHPNWRDGEYTYRKRALEHYGCKCSVCGYDIEDVLEVHHKDGDRSNNKLENLDVLCPTHHKEYTVGIRIYK